MSEEDFLVAFCFVKDNKDGIQMVRTLQMALKIIRRLADEGMSPERLLHRCCHVEYGERLVIELLEKFERNNKRREFVSALVQLPAAWWDENGINARAVLSRMRGHDVLAHLLGHHSQLVTDPDHPLYCDGDIGLADEYWMHRVRGFIVRGDFRRAWDELQKAHRGVLKSTLQKHDFQYEWQYIEQCQLPHNRCWRASLKAVSLLGVELYQVMVEDGLLTTIDDAERLTDKWGRVSVMVYETKVPSAHRRKPREYAQWIQQPGHAIAICFAERDLKESNNRGAVKLRDEGVAILKIAAYFHALRNERRRQNHAIALQAYEDGKAL